MNQGMNLQNQIKPLQNTLWGHAAGGPLGKAAGEEATAASLQPLLISHL